MPTIPAIISADFLQPRQEYLMRFAVLPIYRPVVDVAHDGDDGGGHAVTFYPVPLMGPNRIATVGEQVVLDGSRSFLRGSGGYGSASGHSWTIYGPGVDGLPDPEKPGTGVLAATFSGATVSWNPSITGTFRVELRLSGSNSDTCGMRFVRVFANTLDSDISHTEGMDGDFSVDGGGWEATVTYKPESGASAIRPWQRIVAQIRTFYSDGSLVTVGDETFAHDPVFLRVSDVFFDGLVDTDTLEEDRESETITFKLFSPGFALKKLPLRGYPHTTQMAVGDGTTLTVPVDYPLFFADPDRNIVVPCVDPPVGSPPGTPCSPGNLNVVDFIRQSDVDIPVHEISGMNFTDPILHIMQRHTNFVQFWDFHIDQNLNPYLYPMVFNITNVWDQLKSFSDKGMGNLFSDHWGALNFVNDPRFQNDEWWTSSAPPTAMTFTRDNIQKMTITENPFRVAQVKLVGLDGNNIPLFAQYPNTPEFVGDLISRSAMLARDSATLDKWSARLWVLWNQPYDVEIEQNGINRSLDINDVVDITYTDDQGYITL